MDNVNTLFERALKEMPGSYKLWRRYLAIRVEQLKGKSVLDPSYKEVNNCFERALVFMHKMPRIWLDYCQLLIDECEITLTRRTFDRALQALPITQHNRIWPLYLKFIKLHNIPETAVRVYNRYLKLQPEEAEDFIDYLRGIGRLDEASIKLADITNREGFISKDGKSKYQLWTELCELVSKNPDKVQSLKVEAIIREGIKRYTDQQGKLWNALAEYFTRSGLFEKARDIYEEAVLKVMTIRDFSQVFDAYAQSEERLINSKMESLDLSEDDDIELELRLARYEDLIERRPLLLNSVALRQNPHNVEEWHKRVKLLDGKLLEIIETFTDAVQTVDPKQAIGKLHTLWVEFAKFYEVNGQVDDARLIFEKATQANYIKVEDLASVWCEWAELELRNCPEKALKIMQRATAPPPKKTSYYDINEPVQNRVYKSLKVWSLYADLEESFGTLQTTKAVYDRIIDLKIATPQIIINYGLFLEENNYFEEAFKSYEKGIDLFKWPNVYDIWNTYLTKFLDRYKGSKLERARDLFEQCLTACPAKYSKCFYLLWAKLEEEHGLAKHAMAVYDRATTAVQREDMFEMFNMYIRKAAELFGVTYTRQIYEKAIETLPDEEAKEMCLRFADLERKLGEIDRARAVYGHCSQLCDPRTSPNFWAVWKEFEIKHGNEDTIREMLRIKRSVQATFNTQVNFMSAQMSAATDAPTTDMKALEQAVEDEGKEDQDDDEIDEELEGTLPVDALAPGNKSSIAFVRSSLTSEATKETEGQMRDGPSKTVNPDEIDIDEDDDEDEEEGEEDEARPAKRSRGMYQEKKVTSSGLEEAAQLSLFEDDKLFKVNLN